MNKTAALWIAERAEYEAHDALNATRKLHRVGLATRADVWAAENKAREACQRVLSCMIALKPWLSPARTQVAMAA